jgi:hypothetical protein
MLDMILKKQKGEALAVGSFLIIVTDVTMQWHPGGEAPFVMH